jgi:hypothetical protein
MNGSTGQAFSAASPMAFYNFVNGSLLAGGGLTVNSNFSVAKEFKVTSLLGINLNTGDITLKSDALVLQMLQWFLLNRI